MKKEEFSEHLLIRPNLNVTEAELISFLEKNKTSKKIFFFDDINIFISKIGDAFNNMLRLLIESKQIIIATLMTGDEYKYDYDKYYELSISTNNKEYLQSFIIERFDTSLIKTKDLHKIKNDNFDGTIGSLLFKLEEMKARFFELSRQKKSKNPDDLNAYRILDVLKRFFILLNFEEANQYSKDKIYEYFKTKHPKTDEDDFDEAIIHLENFDFINVQSMSIIDTIYIDNVYLEKIVNTQISIENALHKVDTLFDKQQQKELGFYLGANKVHTLLYEAENSIEIDGILKRMSHEEIPKNKITYGILMYKTDSLDKASELWLEMDSNNIEKSTVTYNTYLKKLNLKEASELWLEMDSNNIEKSTVTYSTYLQKLNLKEASELWLEMDSNNIEKDTVTYSIFLKLCSNKEEMKYILKQLIKKDRFNKQVLIDKLKKVINPDELTFLINQIKQDILKDNDNIEKFAIILERYHHSLTSKLAIDLLSHIANKSSSIFNILGNCYKQLNPELAIEHYQKAIDSSTKENKKEFFYKNICDVIINNNLKEKESLAIESAKKAIELSNIRPFYHPFYHLLFFEIKNLKSPDLIHSKIREFQNKYKLNKSTIYKKLKKYPLNEDILFVIRKMSPY